MVLRWVRHKPGVSWLSGCLSNSIGWSAWGSKGSARDILMGWIYGLRTAAWGSTRQSAGFKVHLELNIPMQCCGLGEECFKSCSAERHLGVLANGQLNLSQHMPRYSWRPMAFWPVYVSSRMRAVIVPLHTGGKPHLRSCVQFRDPCSELLKCVLSRATELVEGLENKDQLNELGRFSQEKKKPRGEFIALYNFLKGSCSEVKVILFYHVPSQRIRENDLKLHQGKFRLENNFSLKEWLGIE